jgi:hypothetical protein
MRKSLKCFFASLVVALLAPLLQPSEGTAVIQAILEEPGPGGVAAGISNIRGWAFSTTGTINPVLQVSIDGAPSVEIPCCSSRGDVKSQNPGAPLRSGFSGIFNWSLLDPGSHTLSVHLTSTSGESKMVSATFTTSRLGAFQFLQSFDLLNADAGVCFVDEVEGQICCDGTLATAVSGSATCDGVCYRWVRGSQSLVMTESQCTSGP